MQSMSVLYRRQSRSGRKTIRLFIICVLSSVLLACGGSGGSAPPPSPPPAPPPPMRISDAEAVRFLKQATFGPAMDDITLAADSGLSAWIQGEFTKTPTLHLQGVLAQFPGGRFVDANGDPLPGVAFTATNSFWQAAVEADDQLRQRMAFALSQILVVSNQDFNLFRQPQTLAAYMDILTENAFGNYRDLLEEVTYSVAMADFLTYLRNAKGDMMTGRVPDENYARELMQLFTIGLVELNPDGTPMLVAGEPVETFDNVDVTGLARVFTGLGYQGGNFFAFLGNLTDITALFSPLEIYPTFHSDLEKSFLTVTIPPNTGAAESIDIALDTLFNHQNTAPFVSRQLIQRFVTSDPDPAYVERVANAFSAGRFTLPGGTVVGDGRRGDLRATISAILFDNAARDPNMASFNDVEFGKVREPIIRFVNWARAFNVNSGDAANEVFLLDTGNPALLAQAPYRSPSVFNFYRPGYIAPGTNTGDAGLTAPELQIVNASSISGYINFLTFYIISQTPKVDDKAPATFVPDYSAEIALADNPIALVDRLDLLLTSQTMEQGTKNRIIEALELIPLSTPATKEELNIRTVIAVLMAVSTPEYTVQR